MNDLMVRGTYKKWDCELVMVFGTFAFGIGILRSASVTFDEHAFLLLTLGVICWLGAIAVWRARIRHRLWGTDTGASLILRGQAGEREISDDAIVVAGTHVTTQDAHDAIVTRTRYFTIEFLGSSSRVEKLTLSTTFSPGQADPLAPLIDRNIDRLVGRAEERLGAGEPVIGENWELRGRELTLWVEKKEIVLALDDLAAADFVEGQLRFWRRDEVDAFVGIPEASGNTRVLHRLLMSRLPGPAPASPSSFATSRPDDGLGRIIFERHHRWRSAFFLLLAILIGSCGLYLLLISSAFDQRDSRELRIVVLICLVAAAAFAIYAYACWVVFRCHENGVYRRTLFGERTLRYTQVKAFTYSSELVEGATRLHMRFDADFDEPSISFGTRVTSFDAELDKLRDHVSQIIAARLHEEWRSGVNVPWTWNMSFSPGGLLVNPAKRPKETELVPYSEIDRYTYVPGGFLLWVRNDPEAFVGVPYDERNFFPGFHLLQRILQDIAASSTS